jgi:hypothetical protein
MHRRLELCTKCKENEDYAPKKILHRKTKCTRHKESKIKNRKKKQKQKRNTKFYKKGRTFHTISMHKKRRKKKTKKDIV